MDGKKKELLELFENDTEIEPIIDINLDNISLGMTDFQIRHFVLNKREFPTELMIFSQAKLELYTRIQNLYDLLYQYRKAKARIKLAEGEIEELELIKKINPKKKEAKIELQTIEIEKYQFQLVNIKKQAVEKLRECQVFYQVYGEFKDIDDLGQEEIAKLEEEGWKIKSAYFIELGQRYGLTPDGFQKLPHEDGGLKSLLKSTDHELSS